MKKNIIREIIDICCDIKMIILPILSLLSKIISNTLQTQGWSISNKKY